MQNPTRLILMTSNQDNDRDRPTDPVTHAPPDASSESASLGTIAPPARLPSWTDTQLQTFIELAKEIKAAQEAQNLDALLDRQTERISQRIDESDRRSDINYSLVAEQVRGLVHSIDAIGIRVGHIETKQESSADRLQRMELEMASMRHQVDRMDEELIALKEQLDK